MVAVAGAGGRLRRLAETPPQQFRIDPVRPVAELLPEARRAVPPRQPAGLRAPDLVDVASLDPTIRLDIRYATREQLPRRAGVPAGAGVATATGGTGAGARPAQPRGGGLGVVVYDGYRPWSVTWVFWQATPPHMHEFVADPADGSVHNRGCAVDLGSCASPTAFSSRCPAVTTR